LIEISISGGLAGKEGDLERIDSGDEGNEEGDLEAGGVEIWPAS